MTDYYAILGVNPTAEDIVIRAAYKAPAQRYHPDRFAGSKEEAHRRMSELTQAYEVLADPVRRPKYDRRRKLYTRAVGARMNHARRFASVALDPRAYRAIREVRGRYRAALAALMGVVVVLSAFNLYTHSARIKSWLGFNAIGTSMPSPADADARALQAAIDMGPPAPAIPAAEASTSAGRASVKEKKRAGTRNAASSRPANTAPAATASQPCDDVAAALGLCTRDKAAVK
jgi:curved DNA-binding protein CbpA